MRSINSLARLGHILDAVDAADDCVAALHGDTPTRAELRAVLERYVLIAGQLDALRDELTSPSTHRERRP
ncbi:hypothetical protein [Mycobacterium simiae]|uniref:Uncharacterized protein n=1 Tax=Mycobacterium simiae TaxID=1784 RepID=A0A1X0Y194_MYCSI|nr:hypothetical protein [Mycobacterium simiae]ORJ58981.1 hypothetical protein B5M45_17865 [Mycobacterium simiae]